MWFTGTNESHNLEVGKSESRKWKDSNSGKGGKLRLQEMDRLLRGAEVQQRAGREMYQRTPPPLPHHQDHSGMMQHFRLISNIVFLP